MIGPRLWSRPLRWLARNLDLDGTIARPRPVRHLAALGWPVRSHGRPVVCVQPTDGRGTSSAGKPRTGQLSSTDRGRDRVTGRHYLLLLFLFFFLNFFVFFSFVIFLAVLVNLVSCEVSVLS